MSAAGPHARKICSMRCLCADTRLIVTCSISYTVLVTLTCLVKAVCPMSKSSHVQNFRTILYWLTVQRSFHFRYLSVRFVSADFI